MWKATNLLVRAGWNTKEATAPRFSVCSALPGLREVSLNWCHYWPIVKAGI